MNYYACASSIRTARSLRPNLLVGFNNDLFISLATFLVLTGSVHHAI
jgi:hypothetical protein